MKRKETAQIVANLEDMDENTITKKANYLVMGNYDYINAMSLQAGGIIVSSSQ
jgi:hypothetical protein